ncbi:hypothetical protein H0266_14325 [Halobacillus locisalis]|uniref:Uncharacterized protein n=1 Tax=Halobacillus locisalis TaxID=220753 RepID=A0A838CW62_9BACI|nr:hypothetical protein [Halobacillus locisalis]MBA2176069.1 hypothetical protein [Halobacillus locisalis]
MYMLIRYVDDKRQSLKKSSSSVTKYFDDYEEAVGLKNKINQHTSLPQKNGRLKKRNNFRFFFMQICSKT